MVDALMELLKTERAYATRTMVSRTAVKCALSNAVAMANAMMVLVGPQHAFVIQITKFLTAQNASPIAPDQNAILLALHSAGSPAATTANVFLCITALRHVNVLQGIQDMLVNLPAKAILPVAAMESACIMFLRY
jgi:hypothetical protein